MTPAAQWGRVAHLAGTRQTSVVAWGEWWMPFVKGGPSKSLVRLAFDPIAIGQFICTSLCETAISPWCVSGE